jgi:hypothetical protein
MAPYDLLDKSQAKASRPPGSVWFGREAFPEHPLGDPGIDSRPGVLYLDH